MEHLEMYPTGSAKVLAGKVLSYFGSRRSNQSNLEEISPEYSLEGLMLKLQLQYFVHLMKSTVSLKLILILGRNEGQGEWDERG